jgi:hypothetical protein
MLARVHRYMASTDVYVHADVHGAATTIIKNHISSSPVSPLAISQAGTAAVCRSKAWDSKIVTSAWWVHPHQVSKAAPTGEALTTGSFVVRGKKNYLPPSPLVFGFAFVFRLADDSLERHAGDRAVVTSESSGPAATGASGNKGCVAGEGWGEAGGAGSRGPASDALLDAREDGGGTKEDVAEHGRAGGVAEMKDAEGGDSAQANELNPVTPPLEDALGGKAAESLMSRYDRCA